MNCPMDMSPAVHGKSGLSFSSDLGDHQLRPRCYRSPNFDHPLRVSNGEVRQGLESRTPRRAVLEGHGTGELCPLSTPSVARIQRERYIFLLLSHTFEFPPWPGLSEYSLQCSVVVRRLVRYWFFSHPFGLGCRDLLCRDKTSSEGAGALCALGRIAAFFPLPRIIWLFT